MNFTNKYIILYDGDCGFCNFWVQWILKHDKKDQFLFASLQSDFGQTFLKERNLKKKEFNTLYLYVPEQYYLIKSQAIARIAKILGGRFGILYYFNLFPSFFGDSIYDFVAMNREKLKSNHCTIPTAEEKKKFLN